MPVSSNKILVKVGKSSRIKFRGIQTFRAVTLDELDRLSKINPDASIVIIENIKQGEDEKLKNFIAEFESADNKKVFFYVEDNDDATCGVADELAYDIYLNLKDLYRAIKLNCGLVVDIDIALSPEFNKTSSLDDSFDDSFQDALYTISNINDSKQLELPDIETKDDLTDFDTSIVEETIADTENESIEIHEEKESADTNISVEFCNTQVDELTTKLSASEKEITQLKRQLHEAFEKSKTLSNLAKALEVERDTFKDRLKLFNENTLLEEPISLVQYQELENRIKQLSEKGQLDQATAGQIEEIKAKLARAEEEKAEFSRQLDEYKDRLKESGSKLSVAQNKLVESEEKINALKTELEELKSKAEQNSNTSLELQSALSDTLIAKETISKLESQAEEDKGFIQQIKSEVISLTNERESLLDRIEHEVKSRLFIMNMLFDAIRQIAELSLKIEANDKVNESLRETITSLRNTSEQNNSVIVSLQSQLDKFKESEAIISKLEAEKAELHQTTIDQSSTIDTLNSTILSNEEKINTLEVQVSDVEKRVELARNFAKEELDKATREAIEWKTKYDIIQAQFSSKEAQYNTLVQSVGMNENGVNSLLENNRTMDEINRTLRDQIVMLKGDLEKANKDKIFAQQTASALEESNKNMRVSMKAMSVGMSGGVNVSSGVPPFQYQGRGMVIPVFGCGSFGITTTAMSIANKLSAQARVLYVDFDMVAPKADGWFKVNPLIRNVPDIEPNSPKATGLGLFVDKQVQYFLSNIASIIAKPIQTKSGCIDYISGFYAKPDAIKLMSADFGSFLNYCGNSYTYVIIDFGRLGSSDINDQIIKAFSDIAYRSVVVTTSDKFEIRTFRMKLAEAKIDINNVAWLVNMCERTNLEDTAKKAISPALYSLMTFNPDLYGKKLDFTKDRLTRDKLSLFMEKVLFRK